MIQQFIEEGCRWMYPILAVSVVGLMFVLERAWFWFVLWMRQDLRLRRRLLNGQVPPPGTRTGDPRTEVLLDLAMVACDTMSQRVSCDKCVLPHVFGPFSARRCRDGRASGSSVLPSR